MIPAVNEELTISDFVAWCRQGLGGRRCPGRDPHHRQLHRPDRRAGAGRRGPGAPHTQAGPRSCLHRRPSLHPGALRRDGRCRLHLRLPAPGSIRRQAPPGRRLRHGVALAGVDRAGVDAGPAPLPRDPGHDVDPQPALREPVHRHPLRHARHQPRRPRAHGARLAVVGVRVGDGAQVGADETPHQRGPGHVLQGPGGPGLAPQARRVGSRRSRPPGSTSGPCSSTAPSSSL